MANFYMTIAFECSKMSRAQRLQVGAIIVKNNNILSFSWNGTPEGWDNTCEERVYMSVDAGGWLDIEDIEKQWPHIDSDGRRYKLKTKPEVLHAERNALDKLARGSESGMGAAMFVTHSPCLECAKSIYGAGITVLYYKHDYRNTDGLEFLKRCGVKIEKQ